MDPLEETRTFTFALPHDALKGAVHLDFAVETKDPSKVRASAATGGGGGGRRW
jgi:hypothetical protein